MTYLYKLHITYEVPQCYRVHLVTVSNLQRMCSIYDRGETKQST